MKNEPYIRSFTFTGKLVFSEIIPSNSEADSNTLKREAVSSLNEQGIDIAREIEQEMERLLLPASPSLSIKAKVRFYTGSISWTGVIYVIDWMGRIAAAVEFANLVRQMVEVVVEQVIYDRLPDNIVNGETKTHIQEVSDNTQQNIEPVQSPTDSRATATVEPAPQNIETVQPPTDSRAAAPVEPALQNTEPDQATLDIPNMRRVVLLVALSTVMIGVLLFIRIVELISSLP